MGEYDLSSNLHERNLTLFLNKANLSDIKISPKFEAVFKFFSDNPNKFLEVTNNNSIFETIAAQQHLEPNLYGEESYLITKDLSINNRNNQEQSEAFTEIELQEIALETLLEDTNRTRQIFNKQNGQGRISNAINWVKELFNTENAATNIDRALMIDNFSTHLIQKASSEEGITFREYYEAKIEFITQLIAKFDKALDERSLEKSREALKKLEPERLDSIIQTIGSITDNCTQEELPELIKEIVNMQFEAQDSNSLVTNISISEIPHTQIPESTSKTLENLIASGEFDKKMTFEETFKLERGVEYNSEAINDYALKNTQLQVLSGMNNNIAAIDIFLDKLRENEGEIYCSTKLEKELNDFLQKFGIKVTNNRREVLTALIDLRQKAEENYNKALGGKTLDDYSTEANTAYEKAYGKNNISTIVNNYIQSQQEGLQVVKTGVQAAGMVTMIAGQVIPAGGQLAAGMIYGGMAAATLGGTAISAVENFTKENGPTEQDKKEMVKELSTAIALTTAGAGIGKVSESAFRILVLKNCPKLLAWSAEIGIDAAMSLAADAAITGDIDVSAEGFSQSLNILTGIIRTKGNFKTYLDTHAGKPEFGLTEKTNSKFVHENDQINHILEPDEGIPYVNSVDNSQQVKNNIPLDYIKLQNLKINNMRLLDFNSVSGGTFSIRSSEDLLELKSAGIKQIIDFRAEAGKDFAQICKENDLEYFNFPIDHTRKNSTKTDNTPIEISDEFVYQLKQYFQLLESGNAYVGCHYGIDRTNLGLAYNYLLNLNTQTPPTFLTWGQWEQKAVRNKTIKEAKKVINHLTPEQYKILNLPDNYQEILKERINNLLLHNCEF